MPTAFNTLSADNGSPLDIMRPEYAEHMDDEATVFAGLALQAILSAGVLAKAGAASSGASMIGMRAMCFIGRSSVRLCFFVVGKVNTIITRG